MEQIIATSIAGIGVLGLLLQLIKAHRWNRRQASHNACFEFMQPHHITHWKKIRSKVMVDKKDYYELNEDEKESCIHVMCFLESLGISLKHGILEEDVIFDYFGSVWPRLFFSCKKYIDDEQKARDDKAVFECFEGYGERFDLRENDFRNRSKTNARLKGLKKL